MVTKSWALINAGVTLLLLGLIAGVVPYTAVLVFSWFYLAVTLVGLLLCGAVLLLLTPERMLKLIEEGRYSKLKLTGHGAARWLDITFDLFCLALLAMAGQWHLYWIWGIASFGSTILWDAYDAACARVRRWDAMKALWDDLWRSANKPVN